MACKGLIRFAIIKYLKANNCSEEKSLSVDEFLIIISTHIKEQLINASFSDIEKKMQEFILEVTMHKAIFTMSV